MKARLLDKRAGWFRALVCGLLAGAALLAAPAAQAFTEENAGIYTVLDKEGKLTNIAFRFYLLNGKWVAEERAADGGWTPFKCEKDCEIKAMTDPEIKDLFGKSLQDADPKCIGNGNFAVCRYILKKAADTVRFMMMVQTPKGVVAVPLSWTSAI